ncbi:MAG: rhodanese-like domain-containing protein [Planctomycetes bacterium]|nr:rhodanese-like domain-containing protein [Planctomycetota bacterium]
MPTTMETISKNSTMREILEAMPGAQRALFARYHIGGCSSCGFQPDDRLETVLLQHNIWEADEVVRYLKENHDLEAKSQISVQEVAEARKRGEKLALLDVRSPEEYEMAHIEGAKLVTEDLAAEVLEKWAKDTQIVFHCHLGQRSLEAVAFLKARGFTNVRSMTGGIDAWSTTIDSKVPRYGAAPSHCKG